MKVYVKINQENLVVAYADPGFTLGTDAILAEYNGNVGQGIQLLDERSIFRYKLDGDVMIERSQEEMDADYATRPAPPPSDKERITQLEEELKAAKILLGLEV